MNFGKDIDWYHRSYKIIPAVLEGEEAITPGNEDVLGPLDVDFKFPGPGVMVENGNLRAKAAFLDPIYSAETNVPTL